MRRGENEGKEEGEGVLKGRNSSHARPWQFSLSFLCRYFKLMFLCFVFEIQHDSGEMGQCPT